MVFSTDSTHSFIFFRIFFNGYQPASADITILLELQQKQSTVEKASILRGTYRFGTRLLAEQRPSYGI